MANQIEVSHNLSNRAQSIYKAPNERAAIRCALGDAAALCDWLVKGIKAENRGHKGKGAVTKRGHELAAVAKRCADAIWEMRELIHVGD